MITFASSFRIFCLLGICVIDRLTGHYTHTPRSCFFLFHPCWFRICRFARRCFFLFYVSLVCDRFWLLLTSSCEDHFWGLGWVFDISGDLASAADTEALCVLFFAVRPFLAPPPCGLVSLCAATPTH